jgi:hypothetical protein
MDFVGLFCIQSSFPFVAAIVAIRADHAATLGDCFVFVENRRNFFGFRRVKMPSGISLSDAQARMRDEVQRVHDKMGEAAMRKGLLPQIDTPFVAPGLSDAPSNLISDLWNNRGFSSVLEWVGKITASPLLGDEINKCASSTRS